mmetsp:Transcript_103343/g.230818  ORF Transcript_103343/g.230818 Transcript_103343/m.230818 type:complete len:416 (-) Transcript_103343:118-1365(-)
MSSSLSSSSISIASDMGFLFLLASLADSSVCFFTSCSALFGASFSLSFLVAFSPSESSSSDFAGDGLSSLIDPSLFSSSIFCSFSLCFSFSLSFSRSLSFLKRSSRSCFSFFKRSSRWDRLLGRRRLRERDPLGERRRRPREAESLLAHLRRAPAPPPRLAPAFLRLPERLLAALLLRPRRPPPALRAGAFLRRGPLELQDLLPLGGLFFLFLSGLPLSSALPSSSTPFFFFAFSFSTFSFSTLSFSALSFSTFSFSSFSFSFFALSAFSFSFSNSFLLFSFSFSILPLSLAFGLLFSSTFGFPRTGGGLPLSESSLGGAFCLPFSSSPSEPEEPEANFGGALVLPVAFGLATSLTSVAFFPAGAFLAPPAFRFALASSSSELSDSEEESRPAVVAACRTGGPPCTDLTAARMTP